MAFSRKPKLVLTQHEKIILVLQILRISGTAILNLCLQGGGRAWHHRQSASGEMRTSDRVWTIIAQTAALVGSCASGARLNKPRLRLAQLVRQS